MNPLTIRLHGLLSQLVPLLEEEVAPVLFGVSSLFCLLASYFIVVPLREDAAITLGTSALPKLFILSLVGALVAAPLVSSFLNKQSARGRDRSLRRLYLGLAAIQFGFYLAYSHTDGLPSPGFLASGPLSGRDPHPQVGVHATLGVQGGAGTQAALVNAAAGAGAPVSDVSGEHTSARHGGGPDGGDAGGSGGSSSMSRGDDLPQAANRQAPQAADVVAAPAPAGGQQQQQQQGQQEQPREGQQREYEQQLRHRALQQVAPLGDAGDAEGGVGNFGPGSSGVVAHAVTPAGQNGGAAGAESNGGGSSGSSSGRDGSNQRGGSVEWDQDQPNQQQDQRGAPATTKQTSGGGNNGDSGSTGDSSSGSSSGDDGGGSSNTASKPRTTPATGVVHATTRQRLLRAVFYVWVGTYNLVSISSLWARCADVFASESASRLFGVISAGATLGQLSGSVTALALASRGTHATEAAAAAAAAVASTSGAGVQGGSHGAASSHASSPPVNTLLILLSSGLLCAASQLAPRIRQQEGGLISAYSLPSGRGGAPSAGGAAARAALLRKRLSVSSGGGGGGDAGVSGGVRRHVSGAGGSVSGGGGGEEGGAARVGGGEGAAGGGGGGKSSVGELFAGFKLVFGSEYLLLVCAYLLMTYVVGSLLYFARALVVSKSAMGPGDRTAFFAWLNSWSAALIALCQLFATAGLLRLLGVSMALALGPGVCLLGLMVIALRPHPSSVAAVEIVRKVCGYAVLRPTREVLFTVVSRTEKYSAKLVIDMVVQRMGDSIAAAAFQLLDVQLHLGIGGVAFAGCVMCFGWLIAAVRLGQIHGRIMQGRSRKGGGEPWKQKEKQEV